MRVLLAAAAVAATFGLQGVPSGAAPAPARSGTILGGWAPGAAYLGPSPRGCMWTAECLAWRASGCDPALAGRDPGLHDSIVDVRGLASRTRLWRFALRPDGPTSAAPLVIGGLTVELWTASCRPLGEVGNVPGSSTGIEEPVTFRIPPGAAWMTVASSDNTTLRWTLTAVSTRTRR